MAPLVRRPGQLRLILKAPQRSRVQLEEELIVLETDEARAQLDCKAALRGERAAWPCLAID